MEKKLQMTKYVTRDLKNYPTKPRNKEYANEKFQGYRLNTKNLNGSWNNFPKNINKSNNKLGTFLRESVSLSNEDYIIANAQIWVNQESKSYDDIYSNWNDIIQINFYTNDDLSCPICMEPPIIPRSDKCGHVYCLPCLNKFLSLKSEFHNKCALCNQYIDHARIKRAGILSRVSVKNGDYMSMILMKRNKNDFFPTPIDTSILSAPYINTPESLFSNMAVCSNNDLLSILQMEIMVLEDELKAAIKEENDRIIAISEALESVRDEFNIASGTLSVEPKKAIISDVNTIDSLRQIMDSSSVYYQCDDGATIFMCPVNWKCMSHEFLDNGLCLPTRIKAKIIDIEKFTVTIEFQNRYRYLRYLPIGSSVSFVELDLRDIVSQATLDKFHEAIQRKTDTRVHKQKLDDLLTSKKIKQENSFNKAAGFTYLPSLMQKNESFFDSDFCPLSPVASIVEPQFSNVDAKDRKKSFADMIQAHRPPSVVTRLANLSVAEGGHDDGDGPGPVSRGGISLSDCVVIKTGNKSKKRR